MSKLIYLSLLVTILGLQVAIPTNGHDLVNCGCHEAPSCSQCGSQPDECHGDCIWKGSECIHNEVTDAWMTKSCKKYPFVPNIGYLFKGYDILKGNPLQEDTIHFDPGLRQPIFKAEYKKRHTADQRYQIPEGTSVLDCSGCSLSFSTKQVSDTQSYQDSLSLKANIEGGGWGAKFSASFGYRNVESKTSSSETIFTHAEASCCSYQAQITTYDPPPFSADFINAIKNLPAAITTSQDIQRYFNIFRTFGTHYITQINMGGLYGEETELSKTDQSTLTAANININLAASYSGFDITTSGSFTDDSKKTMAHTFQSSSSNRRVYSVGAPPPMDNNMGKWAQEVDKSPGIMSMKLSSICKLFRPPYTIASGIALSPAVQRNCMYSLNAYCFIHPEANKFDSCGSGVYLLDLLGPKVSFKADNGEYWKVGVVNGAEKIILENYANECDENSCKFYIEPIDDYHVYIRIPAGAPQNYLSRILFSGVNYIGTKASPDIFSKFKVFAWNGKVIFQADNGQFWCRTSSNGIEGKADADPSCAFTVQTV